MGAPKHVADLVGCDRLVAVLGDPAKVGAVLVSVGVRDAAVAAAGAGEDQQYDVGSVPGVLFAACSYGMCMKYMYRVRHLLRDLG